MAQTVSNSLARVVNDPGVVTALLEVINDRHSGAHQNAVRKALEYSQGDEGARVESLLYQGQAEALSALYKLLDKERKVAKV